MIDEDQMRMALGLPVSPKAPRKEKPRLAHRLNVVLSVREQAGGLPRRFEHSTRTYSQLEAEVEACKAAKKKGLRVWCVIGVETIND